MGQTAEQFLQAALTLPDEDRLELVEALLTSLQTEDRPFVEDSWREVIRRRSAELSSGQVVGVPWEEVKRRAREKAGG
jgi:putative addiction module component (TIGR02574 family)